MPCICDLGVDSISFVPIRKIIFSSILTLLFIIL